MLRLLFELVEEKAGSGKKRSAVASPKAYHTPIFIVCQLIFAFRQKIQKDSFRYIRMLPEQGKIGYSVKRSLPSLRGAVRCGATTQALP